MVRPEWNSRPPSWQPDNQPTEPPVGDEIEMLRHILLIVTYFKQWLINLRVQSTYSNLYFLK